MLVEDLFPRELYNLPQVFAVAEAPLSVLTDARDLKLLSDPFGSVWRKESYELLDKAFATLPIREAEVLRRHFGIGTDPMTLEEIAHQFGVGKERIRQLEMKALRRLRHPKVRHLIGSIDQEDFEQILTRGFL